MTTATELRTIRCDVRPPIVEIVLDRPEAGNTFTPELLSELGSATAAVATDTRIRAVVLRGAGKNFCFGADVDMFLDQAPEDRPALIRDLVTRFHGAITRLRRLEMPVLGVAHGMSVGGGLSLLAACDVVVAAESSRFRLGWPGIGITMDGGATWLLPRIIGAHRTLELVYTNRIFTCAEAEAWGFVNWTVPDESLDQRAAELADMLAAGPTQALGVCKRLVTDGASQSFETHLEDEAVAVVRSFTSRDSEEGFRAFRERRAPAFLGR
ncbi:MAG TPA: enoyl-CoA hydratase-related protein [Acidimicrobiia bacterium]|jgi:2-(1,2-epoxy-1,2-dihydrophenyl)acetyl-CoA isomerase|nr:enoyl-CoA hydratase-related protein [Acidimicrobiia bacterium]